MPSVARIGSFVGRVETLLVALLAVVLVAACTGSADDATHPACAKLESLLNRDDLIDRNQAEEMATEELAFSAPEVTGVEIERVVGSCLTTLLSYQQDLRQGGARTNPAVYPHDMPVWIVEVKGISRPAGISAANANNPYRYALSVINAATGESFAGSRYRESLLEPEREE